MAAQVLIAHTGQRLQIDASQLSSCALPVSSSADSPLKALRLDIFKAAVSRETSIPAHCIIALTPQGKPLKLQTIQTEVGGPRPLLPTAESVPDNSSRKRSMSTIVDWHRHSRRARLSLPSPSFLSQSATSFRTLRIRSRKRDLYTRGKSYSRPDGTGHSRWWRTVGRWPLRLGKGTARWT